MCLWDNDEPTERSQQLVLGVVDVLSVVVEPMRSALGVVVAELLGPRDVVLASGLDLKVVALDPCTDSLVLSIENLLCCAPLIAEDGVVHLKDDVLGVEVLWWVVAEADLPTLIVRASAQVESDFSGHGVQGFL
jgi:hypothetical protein